MSDPSTQEPDWFKKFKEANTKGGGVAPEPAAASRPSTESSGAERRRHHRFDLQDTTLTLYRDGFLTLIGVGKENKAKVAVNISEGGIQVIIRERLSPGAKVKMKLQIEKFKDAIEAVGIVRWCYQNSKRKDDYHAGIQFENLPSIEGRKIASMRDWFTSTAYRPARETKPRKKPGDELQFPQ